MSGGNVRGKMPKAQENYGHSATTTDVSTWGNRNSTEVETYKFEEK